MRIWLVNHYALPSSEPGGTRHYALARELIERGHQVALIAASFNHQLRRQMDLSRRASPAWPSEDVPFIWLRTPPYPGNGLRRIGNMVAFAAQVWTGLWTRRLERPDVVIGSSPHLLAALAAERLAARFRVPFVLEVRDIWPQSLIDLGGISAGHPVTRLLERMETYLYRRARRIVALLPNAGEHIAARGGRAESVVWIPNGVVPSSVPPPTPPADDGVFTVMYAGAHGLANGLDVVLDAAAILQREGLAGSVRFCLVGDGPEKPRLVARARAEGLQNVAFRDSVPKDQVYGLLQGADTFVVTMRRIPLYRFGISFNKIFDYFACARPIVFGTNARNDPVAEAGAGLSVPPEQPHALAAAVRELASKPVAERWEMGLRGWRYVMEHHNFGRLAGRLEQLLADVVAEGVDADTAHRHRVPSGYSGMPPAG